MLDLAMFNLTCFQITSCGVALCDLDDPHAQQQSACRNGTDVNQYLNIIANRINPKF